MERFFTKLDLKDQISTYETENQEKSYSTERGTNLRRNEQPLKVHQEDIWFKSCSAPGVLDSEILPSTIATFKDMIWNNNAHEMLREYGMTPDEMAVLCGEDGDGWLLTSHMVYLLNKMTVTQDTCRTLLFCLNAVNASLRMNQLRDRYNNFQEIDQLVFVINVGKFPDNSVFISSNVLSGCHWTLAVVKFDRTERSRQATVFYCDSMAWGVPEGLLVRIQEFTDFLNVQVTTNSLKLCHSPTPVSERHTCRGCSNYPLQRCASVCGVVALICAAVATFDRPLFQFICGPRNSSGFYLHDPTRYSKYLRLVLVSWFVSGKIYIRNVSVRQIPLLVPTTSAVSFVQEHTYAQAVKERLQRKRKISLEKENVCPGQEFKPTKVKVVTEVRNGLSTRQPLQPKVNVELAPPTSKPCGSDTKNNVRPGQVLEPGKVKVEVRNGLPSGQPLQPEVKSVPPTSKPCRSDPVRPKVEAKNDTEDRCAETRCKTSVGSITSHASGTPSSNDQIPSHAPKPKKNPTGQAKSLSSSKFVCPYCEKELASRQSLHSHKKTMHPTEKKDEPTRDTIKCCMCKTFSCCNRKELIAHFNSAHGQNFTLHQTEITSGQFEKWISDLEKSSGTHFVKGCQPRRSQDHITTYYYCNRSGCFVPNDSGKRAMKSKGSAKIEKRAMKSQGSAKIEGYCTAFLTHTSYEGSERISLEYCTDHVHGTRISHLNISKDMRSFIVGKLASGVDSKQVLDQIRDQMCKLDGRDKIITHKDILNIKQQFNINVANRDPNDCKSTKIWVHQLQNEEYDPILVFKEQGTSLLGLEEDRFLLGIQTEFQRDIMLEFGPSAICIDSTHKTTQYDFLVTTVAVVDDYGEAIPVAWLISDKEDETVLVPFVEALRGRVGNLQTDVFMSDLANNFFNAWCIVFPRPLQRLYCNWHVKKNWNRNILSKVKGEKSQKEVTGILEIVMYEPEEGKFRKALAEALTRLEEISPKFAEYFMGSYVAGDKVKLWATCFRRGAIVNTNMYVEALNRVLKDIYFKRRQNRRVDELLVVLLKMARDKGHERFIKLEKGKITNKIKDTRKRHEPGTKLAGTVAVVTEGSSWTVRSSSAEEECYIVRKERESCVCKLKCNHCDVCLHLLSCTCIDYLIHYVACKHVHAVKVYCDSSDQAQKNVMESGSGDDMIDADDIIDVPVNNNHTEYFERVLCKPAAVHSCDLTEVKKTAAENIAELMEIIESSSDANAIHCSLNYVKAAVATIKGLAVVLSCNDFDKKDSFPSNKHFEAQKRYHSTKEKTKVSKGSVFKRPTAEEKGDLKKKLTKIEPIVCVFCFKEDDPAADSIIHWNQCAKCKIWAHKFCDIQCSDGLSTNEYICSLCNA